VDKDPVVLLHKQGEDKRRDLQRRAEHDPQVSHGHFVDMFKLAHPERKKTASSEINSGRELSPENMHLLSQMGHKDPKEVAIGLREHGEQSGDLGQLEVPVLDGCK